MTIAPPPVMIRKTLPSGAARRAPKPVTISASSAAGTRHRILNSRPIRTGTRTMAAMTTMTMGSIEALRAPGRCLKEGG